MKLGRTLRKLEKELEDLAPSETPPLMRTLAWVSAGVTALALGLVVGRELRSRYKFARRTPYDFYSHSGDEQDADYVVGI